MSIRKPLNSSVKKSDMTKENQGKTTLPGFGWRRDESLCDLRRALALMLAVPMCACASARLIQHGIQPEVKGRTPVSDIQVLYGEKVIDFKTPVDEIQVLYGAKVINFKGKHPPGSGGGWNAPMAVPAVMTVRWTVDNKRQEVSIALEGKVEKGHEIRNWILQFDGTHLELVREDEVGPIDPASHLEPRRRVKVYP